MVSGHDEDSQLARALAGGKPHPTGWFRLYFEDERWEWSPEVERLHGYQPGTAKPTTSVVLSHKHPEDYEQVVLPGTENDDDAVTLDEDEDGGNGRHLDGVIAAVRASSAR